jgi:hypothetical protein
MSLPLSPGEAADGARAERHSIDGGAASKTGGEFASPLLQPQGMIVFALPHTPFPSGQVPTLCSLLESQCNALPVVFTYCDFAAGAAAQVFPERRWRLDGTSSGILPSAA